jgi:hypothetical protein
LVFPILTVTAHRLATPPVGSTTPVSGAIRANGLTVVGACVVVTAVVTGAVTVCLGGLGRVATTIAITATTMTLTTTAMVVVRREGSRPSDGSELTLIGVRAFRDRGRFGMALGDGPGRLHRLREAISGYES